jgi:sulfite reductase (NADPH) hemoprotein beta-component
LPEGTSLTQLALLSPFPTSRLLSDTVQSSTKQLLVLEQLGKWPTKWTPVYLDVISAVQDRDSASQVAVRSVTLGDLSGLTASDIDTFIKDVPSKPRGSRLVLGLAGGVKAAGLRAPHIPKHEASYTKILAQLFGDRLDITNSPDHVQAHGAAATSPEYALGRIRGQLEERKSVVDAVQALLDDASVPPELHDLLSKWTLAKDKSISGPIAEKLIKALEPSGLSSPAASHIISHRQHLSPSSKWIIGSDAWSYDLGASGLHHVIASGLNVNLLLLDTMPYSTRTNVDPARRKQDAGLYAMNHGDVYVASVAVYSSYAQVLQALAEAEAYPGPSLVLAYLPYTNETSSALEVLKETKLAIDAGYWPLYRWNPAKDREGSEPFALDSDAIKAELRNFLDRHNHLSLLERSTPALASELVSNLGDTVRDARKRRAKKMYEELVTAIDAPPLTILYASDGGKAEKMAKRLTSRAKARGLSATVATLDSLTLEALAQEEYVVLITSVAGQGEFPQNGRSAVKAFNQAAGRGEKPLTKLKYSVFGLGDSHYWPRPEDAHYYNKAGKDLDARVASLGGERFAEVGLGDDQDPDGPETGYKAWEPLVWKALGVDAIEVTEAEPEPITNEHIKAASGYLRGTIAEGLEDTTTGAIAPSDGQLTKFHGIYQQDDRDIRDERQTQGVEPAFSFMIRVRMAGGVCKPAQWLAIDRIADEHGNGTFKITTRATFQFHGVIKRHLKPAIQDINRVLLDTLAACGDVNRNVLVSAIPTLSELHKQVYQFANDISEHLLPRTTAYHEIWLDKKMVAGDALKDVEPLYGEFYLPRKVHIKTYESYTSSI